MGRWVLALAALIAFITAGYAQGIRKLPANGKLGELVGQQQPFPMLQIGSGLMRLAPGGLIYDQNNRTMIHAMLPDRATVLYFQDPAGDVTRVYILRPEELELLQRAGPPRLQ
jgi:hypothetical protein